jgi:hypothetical protein
MDSAGTGYRGVGRHCERDNETLGSIKDGKVSASRASTSFSKRVLHYAVSLVQQSRHIQ